MSRKMGIKKDIMKIKMKPSEYVWIKIKLLGVQKNNKLFFGNKGFI
jgi:hypothetical protein